MQVLAENQNVTNQMPVGKENITQVKAQNKPYLQVAPQKLLVKKLHSSAQLPKRGSDKAAGYDLTSCEETVVPSKGKAAVDTGISIAVPPGHYGRVAPRSGLAVKRFIDTGAGVIDEDYRGPVKVILFNFGSEDFQVSPGDRIAQLILEKISTPEVLEVEELDDTARGAGGFGSTGVGATDLKRGHDALDKSEDTNEVDAQVEGPATKAQKTE